MIHIPLFSNNIIDFYILIEVWLVVWWLFSIFPCIIFHIDPSKAWYLQIQDAHVIYGKENNLLIENTCHVLTIQRLSFNKWLGREEIYLIVYYPSGIFVTHNMKESFIVHKKPSNEGTLYIEWSTHFSRLKINTSKSILSNIWDNSMSLEEMLDFKMNYNSKEKLQKPAYLFKFLDKETRYEVPTWCEAIDLVCP